MQLLAEKGLWNGKCHAVFARAGWDDVDCREGLMFKEQSIGASGSMALAVPAGA